MAVSMRWVSVRAALAASVAFLLFAAVDGQAAAGATSPQLVATGSSYAGVAISQWQGQFNEQDGGDINFTVSSSAVGLNDFCNKTVDFGASDLPYSAGASACTPSQVPYPYQYVPDVGGGLAFEYNLKTPGGKQITGLALNAATIAGIFTGSINNWDDSSIAALNPNLKLPNEPITAYYRADRSGENYLLSSYLLATEPTEMTAFQHQANVPSPGQPSATWASSVPSNLKSLQGVGGADAASQAPVHSAGGISYEEAAYA